MTSMDMQIASSLNDSHLFLSIKKNSSEASLLSALLPVRRGFGLEANYKEKPLTVV